MSYETGIIQNYKNGYVQIEAKPQNGNNRYFILPQKFVPAFSRSLNEHSKNTEKKQKISMFLSIFTGCIGAAIFTRNINNVLNKMMIQIASGVSLATVASIGVNEYSKNKESELIKKYRAKELHYVV